MSHYPVVFMGRKVGPVPALMEAELPWSAQRVILSHKEGVLETVKRILDKWTPERNDLLKGLLVDAEMITTADILEDVTKLIFEKAILEPKFTPMFAELFSDLIEETPKFFSEEQDGKATTFKRVLLNSCQEVFEGTDNLSPEIGKMTGPGQELEGCEEETMLKRRYVGNICLIGQLFKQKILTMRIVHHVIQKLMGHDNDENCLEEKNVEAICRLFISIGKELDGWPQSDAYFEQLKELATNSQIDYRWRFMLQNILDLRDKKWNLGLKLSERSSYNPARIKCERCGVLRCEQPNAQGQRCNGCSLLEDKMPDNLAAIFGGIFGNDESHTTVQLKYQMLGFQASVERKISELEGKIIFYLRLIVGLIVLYMIVEVLT